MSTGYIIRFVVILTVAVSIFLTFLDQVTKEKALQNEDIFNKRAILAAVEDYLGTDADGNPITVKKLSDGDVLGLFNDQIEQVSLDMGGNSLDDIKAEDIDMKKEKKKPEGERVLPLYVYNTGKEKLFILSVRGNGLWDEIWGSIALKDDFNTVAGASFDHQGETPGLGAEIKDNPAFSAQFKGKQIYKDDEYVSVLVRKGGARDMTHEVDGISGATVTADGVSEMLDRGIKYYEPYFNKLKGATRTQGMLVK